MNPVCLLFHFFELHSNNHLNVYLANKGDMPVDDAEMAKMVSTSEASVEFGMYFFIKTTKHILNEIKHFVMSVNAVNKLSKTPYRKCTPQNTRHYVQMCCMVYNHTCLITWKNS